MSLEAHGELVPVGGGDPIPLIRETLTVGRRETCDICIRYPNVSGLHCELTFRKGYWYIRDLGSTNGIKVNSTRVLEKLLHTGDEVSIAKRRFTIDYTMPVAQNSLEELLEDEDVMSQPLLEKAGLVRPKRHEEPRHTTIDAGEFLLADEEEPGPPEG